MRDFQALNIALAEAFGLDTNRLCTFTVTVVATELPKVCATYHVIDASAVVEVIKRYRMVPDEYEPSIVEIEHQSTLRVSA